MRGSKPLTINQTAYFLNNYNDHTILELARGMEVSTTKVINELAKIGAKPFVRPVEQRYFGKKGLWKPQPVHNYVRGLQPKDQLSFVRPPCVYSNRRYIYKEIEEME